MESLKRYVDNLFIKYKEDKQVKELKSEILSNLEAKVNDLTANGMEYNEAVGKAKESIKNIDYLIEGNKKIYINKFKAEYIQIILLYFIVAWIITMPLRIIGMEINGIFLLCSIIIGIYYIVLTKNKKYQYDNSKKFIDIQAAYRWRKAVWYLWCAYIFISTAFTTLIRFGSNIWFSRPIHIEGPSAFAELGIEYLLPCISIIIPLFFNAAPKLIIKYEVGKNDEIEE